VANSLVKFAQGLPLSRSSTSPYSLLELVNDLINRAKSNMSSNAVVVPVLQTFTILLEADALRQLPQDPFGLQMFVSPHFIEFAYSDGSGSMRTLVSMAAWNVVKLKSIQRIHESMKMYDFIFCYITF
jgi:hypothetical protein